MENTVSIPITLPATFFWGAITLVGVVIASAAVYITLPKTGDELGPLDHLQSRFGVERLHPVVFLTSLSLWTGLTLVLTMGLFGLILDIATDLVPQRPALSDSPATQNKKTAAIWEFRFKLVQLTALTTVLGAAIALPFTLIRLNLSQQHNRTAEETLFNEKINAATQGLYARRQVTIGEGASIKDHWLDDIVQRNAAIDRLEGLAEENPAEVPRIARLLSVYVRELSSEIPAIAVPKGISLQELERWAEALPKPRSDMEKAAQTLGRLHQYTLTPLEKGEIDLRDANLQCADLTKANLGKALMSGAHLQNSDLRGAQLCAADLNDAHLTWADLEDARLRGATLNRVDLTGAYLGGVQLQHADLTAARMQIADLGRSNLQGAFLENTQFFDYLRLDQGALKGAGVRYMDFSNLPEISDHLGDVFGDASVHLPGNVTTGHQNWPKHWAKTTLEHAEFINQWLAWQATLTPGRETTKP